MAEKKKNNYTQMLQINSFTNNRDLTCCYSECFAF